MNKSHKNCISYHKGELEKNYNYQCRTEYPVPRDNSIRQIDLACFRSECPQAIGIEAESNDNFNNPQIQSNKKDLQEFKELFGKDKTKVFHILVNDIIEFDKELVCDAPIEKPIIIKPNNKFNLPKGRLSYRW